MGSVVCIGPPFKMSCPFFCDQVEMVKDNLANFTPQARREIVRPGLVDFINLGIKPEFALAFSLARMDVQRLVSFVGIEKQPPALHQQNRGHNSIGLN